MMFNYCISKDLINEATILIKLYNNLNYIS